MRRSLLLLALAAAAVALFSATSAAALRGARRKDVGALNMGIERAKLGADVVGDIQPQWIQQRLDHSDPLNTATFKQLYYVNDAHFQPSRRTVFLMIGGEGPISPAYVNGAFNTGPLAQKYGALQVVLEHRFYGQSTPNGDSSVQNLRFLTSAQALDDLVTLHQHITRQYKLPADTRWVTFGGSYSGSLSAWARLKYPNLFLGAFSSSAPLLAVEDFDQYHEVVNEAVGDKCAATIRAAHDVFTEKLGSSSGRVELQQRFRLCKPIESDLDAANFLEELTDPIAEVVQYAGRFPYNISAMCEKLQGASDPVEGYANWWLSQQSEACTDTSYAALLQSLKVPGVMRSWVWQTCTEFGYYQTGNSNKQPFSKRITLEYFLAQCEDAYGVKGLRPNIDFINAYYGGANIVTSNTVFTQGTIDPWSRLGTYQYFAPSTLTKHRLITGTSHCADLYAPKSTDPRQLVEAREMQEKLMQDWFSQQYSLGETQTQEKKLLQEA